MCDNSFHYSISLINRIVNTVLKRYCQLTLSIFSAVYRSFDKDSDGFLSQEEWVVGMSVFLRGTINEKIECECECYCGLVPL